MSDHDISILDVLWKWKLLTTAALIELHFPNKSPSYAHRKLLRMKAKRIIKYQYLGGKNGRSWAWTLTKKGFDTIRPRLSELNEIGFRSESLEHDLVTGAIHLGEWLFGIPQGCEVFTEQQLRRHHVDLYPKWVPKSTIRRPDGYWRTIVGNAPVTVALEVELTAKSPSHYREIASFYSVRTELLRVVWLVEYRGIAELAHDAIQEIKGDGMRLHNFILLKDFLQHGWNAPFILGRDVGKPLQRLFPVSDKGASETSWRHVASTLLLNGLKSPHRSSNYLKLKKIVESHRVGSSLLIDIPNSTSSNNPSKGEPTNEK